MKRNRTLSLICVYIILIIFMVDRTGNALEKYKDYQYQNRYDEKASGTLVDTIDEKSQISYEYQGKSYICKVKEPLNLTVYFVSSNPTDCVVGYQPSISIKYYFLDFLEPILLFLIIMTTFFRNITELLYGVEIVGVPYDVVQENGKVLRRYRILFPEEEKEVEYKIKAGANDFVGDEGIVNMIASKRSKIKVRVLDSTIIKSDVSNETRIQHAKKIQNKITVMTVLIVIVVCIFLIYV